MELVEVLAKKATAEPGNFECLISVTGYEGHSSPRPISYGWRAGDPHGLGPQMDAWMAAHPKFPVQDADPVTPAVEPTPAEKLAAATGLSIEDLRALVKE